jgi:hypothetical protein
MTGQFKQADSAVAYFLGHPYVAGVMKVAAAARLAKAKADLAAAEVDVAAPV